MGNKNCFFIPGTQPDIVLKSMTRKLVLDVDLIARITIIRKV